MTRQNKKRFLTKELYDKYILDEALLNLDEKDIECLDNPLETRNRFLLEQPHLHLLYLFKQPEYIGAACKYLLNLDLAPLQMAAMYNLYTHSFPFLIATRGGAKTWMLAQYCILKAALDQGVKICCVGAGLRQSRHVYEYASRTWNGSPVLRTLFNASKDDQQGPKWQQDRFIIRIGESAISFLPIGDGEKIRGERASIIIIDELQSHNPEILERVVYAFASVSRDPVKNAKAMAKYRKQKDLGLAAKEPELTANQIILAGTAYYQFNHMYKYFIKYRDKIIHKLGKDYDEHCLMRIPYEIIPEGFMDTAIIDKVKEGGITGVAEMEFGAVFSRDSDGFFKASIINNAVAKPQNNIHHDSYIKGCIEFYPLMRGKLDYKYVIAVDPASERDNLSIVVIEVWKDHRRIVYCWSTNKQDYRDKYKAQLTLVDGYYSYCAQKLRELSKLFHTDIIVIESQGGGYAIMEALNEDKNMKQGDSKWWQVIEDKPKESDGYAGLHNIHLIQPSDAEWVYNANHDLKKDIESRVLLFPYTNPIDYAIEGAEPKKGVETVEDVTYELEELKSELIIIEHTKTPNGRDKWDLPKVKQAGQVKQQNQLRKDRYSALLMCNSVARTIYKPDEKADLQYRGQGLGLMDEYRPKPNDRVYVGHAAYAAAMTAILEMQ